MYMLYNSEILDRYRYITTHKMCIFGKFKPDRRKVYEFSGT